MQAHETILKPFLEGTRQYVIPLFQRSYSWNSNNWKILWNDLYALYSEGKNRKHFLGAFVSMPIDMTPSGVTKYLLIDGQQRITTIFLILAAIRDLAKDNDENLSDQINELYLINKFAKETNKYKLFPSQTDREQYISIINNRANLDENNNIVKAYRYFRHKLESKQDTGQSIDLNKFQNILLEEIMVVDIVLDRDENPYLIFESLNAKGEPLTQADLVRNFILMCITDTADQELAYHDFWLPMQNTLGNELTLFIWRYLIKDSTSGKFIRQNEIYDEVKQRLIGANSIKVIDFLMDMHTFSNYYQRLLNPDNEINLNIRKHLKRINRWDIKTIYPFLLNLYRDYEAKRVSSVDFCKILEHIESFVVRRSFCRISNNALNKIFLALYKSVDPNDYVNSVAMELLRRDWPGDSMFRNYWDEMEIYNSGTEKCRHILESLEERMTSNNEPVDLSNDQITIEHIMPQTLNEEWEQQLGEKAESIHETYLHTIGNLTLTGRNSEMGNISFSEKRRFLQQSNFALNKDVVTNIIWSDVTIRKRAGFLFTVALQIWPHPGGRDVQLDGQPGQQSNPTGRKPTGYMLFGTEHPVDTWRQMLLNVLGELAETHGNDFTIKATKVNTNRRTHISTQPDNMIAPLKIYGSPLYVEGNQSSRSVLWLINELLLALGDSREDFEAYW